MASIFFKDIRFALLNMFFVAATVVLGNAPLPAEALPGSPFLGGVSDCLNAYDRDEGKKHPEAQVLNTPLNGGQDQTNDDGSAKMTTCTIPILTMYPPTMNVTFPCSALSKGILQQYLQQVPHNGTLISDSKSSAVHAYAAAMTARMLQHPSSVASQARAQTLGNTQAASDAMGDASKAQASSAIDYNTRYLQNFTSDIGNRWNQIRLNLFVPIAILLLLPGAVLTQMKVLKDTQGPELNYVLPFEGIGRSVIAVFAIGASSLVPNYAIDFANSVTDGIASGYQSVVGSNMYEDAIAFQVRGTPVRTPRENQNAGNAQRWPQDTINSLATFEKNMIYNKKEDQPGQDQADPDRTNEGMPAGAAMTRFAAFGMNSALTATWNILCAFQQAYLAYLFLIGPIACALWVWPIDQFKQAMPNWIEGCITICFWNLFWNTVILLMACFKGVDTTNTLIMTALNFLATASVKYAFDFASLVKDAGEQAAQQAQQGAQQGGQQGGGGKGKSAGGSGQKGGKAGGLKHPLHHDLHKNGKLATNPIKHGPESKPNPFRPNVVNASWEPGKSRGINLAKLGVNEPPLSPTKVAFSPAECGPGTGGRVGGEKGAVNGGFSQFTGAAAGGILGGAVGGEFNLGSARGEFGEGATPVSYMDMPGGHPFQAAYTPAGGNEALTSSGAATFAEGGESGGLIQNAAFSAGGAFSRQMLEYGLNGSGGAQTDKQAVVPCGPGQTGTGGPLDPNNMTGPFGAPGNSIALKTSDGNTLFFAPGQNGEPGMLLSPNAAGGFDTALVGGPGVPGAGGEGDEYTSNFSAVPSADGNGWNVSYNNHEGDVDNFHITPLTEGNGFSVAQTVNGQDMGHSEYSYANGVTNVSEYGAGQTSPSAVHAYMADGSSASAYYSLGNSNPDLRTTTHPITNPDGVHSGFQTNYYAKDSVEPTGSMRHIDNPNGGWTEASLGKDGQLLSVTSQTMNGDGTYTMGTQQYDRDGSGAIVSNEQAVYSLDNNYLQSISSQINSPDMSQVMSSQAYFDQSQDLVSANAVSYENGTQVSATDFARDTNDNYLERQTSFDQYGGVTSVVQAAFDPKGELLGGQVNYPGASGVNEVAISRSSEGEYYARQSSMSGETVAAHLAYDAANHNWTTVQDNNSFSTAQAYQVTAQDAYGPMNVQHQQSGDVINTGSAGPPVVQHLPNADAMVAQTIASIEQLAAFWFEQRMNQHQNTAEVKPLEPVFAAGIDTFPQQLGHMQYQGSSATSYTTAEGLTSYAAPAIENASYVSIDAATASAGPAVESASYIPSSTVDSGRVDLPVSGHGTASGGEVYASAAVDDGSGYITPLVDNATYAVQSPDNIAYAAPAVDNGYATPLVDSASYTVQSPDSISYAAAADNYSSYTGPVTDGSYTVQSPDSISYAAAADNYSSYTAPVTDGSYTVQPTDGSVYAAPSVDDGGYTAPLVDNATYNLHAHQTEYAAPAADNAVYVHQSSFEQDGTPHLSPPADSVRYDLDEQSVYPPTQVETTYQTHAHQNAAPEIVSREYGEQTVYPQPYVENTYQTHLPPQLRQTPPPMETPTPDSYEHNYSNTYKQSHQNNPIINNDARQNAIYNTIMGITNAPLKAQSALPPKANPDNIKKIIDDLKDAAGEHKDPKESDTWQSWAEW